MLLTIPTMDVGDPLDPPVIQFWLYCSPSVLFCSYFCHVVDDELWSSLLCKLPGSRSVWPLPIYNLTLSKGIFFKNLKSRQDISARSLQAVLLYTNCFSFISILVRMPKPKLCIRVYDKPVHQHHIHCSTKKDKSKRKTKQIFLFLKNTLLLLMLEATLILLSWVCLLKKSIYRGVTAKGQSLPVYDRVSKASETFWKTKIKCKSRLVNCLSFVPWGHILYAFRGWNKN